MMLQRIGHVSCVRCNYETLDSMTFEEQDIVMKEHLADKHPDWMTDGGASIISERLAKSDAERIADLERYLADAYTALGPGVNRAIALDDHIFSLKRQLAEARKGGK